MLIRGRWRPASRPDKSRLGEECSGRRCSSPKEVFSRCRSSREDRLSRFGRKSLSLTEYIPDTPGSVDELRVAGVAFNLLAQVTDVHVNRTLVTKLIAPHPCEK